MRSPILTSFPLVLQPLWPAESVLGSWEHPSSFPAPGETETPGVITELASVFTELLHRLGFRDKESSKWHSITYKRHAKSFRLPQGDALQQAHLHLVPNQQKYEHEEEKSSRIRLWPHNKKASWCFTRLQPASDHVATTSSLRHRTVLRDPQWCKSPPCHVPSHLSAENPVFFWQ